MAARLPDINAHDRPLLVVQHSPDSPAGLIGAAVRAAGWRLDVRLGYRGDDLPATTAGHAGLVLLGGAMSADDDAGHPHFPALLALTRRFAAGGLPVLGICLGAQLVARAFGGSVERMAAGEFGHPLLRLTTEGAQDLLLEGLGPVVRPIQWHDDEIRLPPGAVRLIEGAFCRNQAFRLGRHVHGFQCHIEVDEPTAARWSALRIRLHGRPKPGETWIEDMAAHGPSARRFGRVLAERWVRHVLAPARPADGPDAEKV